MRTALLPASLLAAALALTCAAPAHADVLATIDKTTQRMSVAVDGDTRYVWPVSTGRPGYDTPNGTYHPFRMEADHFSKEWDDAPMPHSLFFTKIGHAIHGTVYENRLGTPASHGCVRLSQAHASTLYALVEEQGVLNTTVTLTGSSVVALARNPRGNAIARSDAQQYARQYDDPNYTGSVEPRGVPRPILPQARLDSGYIYPADGSSTEARYPAPRSLQRGYDGQVYYQQQQQPPPGYTNGYGYQYAPQGYYQQPRYDPRGTYGYQN